MAAVCYTNLINPKEPRHVYRFPLRRQRTRARIFNEWAATDRKISYPQSFSEKLDHAKDIRVYGMFDWLSGLLGGCQRERFLWEKRNTARGFWSGIFSAFLTFLQNGLSYAVLIYQIFHGSLGAGDFAFYFGLITGFSAWLDGIGGLLNDMIDKAVKIGYYREYFAVPDHFNHGEGCPLPENRRFGNRGYRPGTGALQGKSLYDPG